MRPVNRSQLLEDDLQSLLDRDLRATRSETDLPVGGAFAGPPQNLQIIGGEIARALSLLPRQAAELQEHAVQQFRAELSTTAGRGPDRRDQLLRSGALEQVADRKSTRLNSSHANISYAVFCLKKK